MTGLASMNRPASLLAFVCVVLVAGSAAAADGLPESEAERLTKEGQELLERGQFAEACDKFDLSLKREDSVNTLALLAFCHERAGKPGKAWNEFRRVEPRVPPGDKAVFVAQHLRALESKVARARLDVGNRTITEVRVDNDVVALEEGRIVADPGAHTVRVVADGKTMSRNARLVLGDNADIVMVEAPPPPPADTMSQVAPPAVADAPPDDGSGRRTVAWALGGAGVVLLGVGIYEGIKTISIKKDADTTCGDGSPTCVTPARAAQASSRRGDAVVPSWIATGGVVLGAVGLGTAIYLLATPSAPPAVTTGGVRWTPAVGFGAAGVTGSF